MMLAYLCSVHRTVPGVKAGLPFDRDRAGCVKSAWSTVLGARIRLRTACTAQGGAFRDGIRAAQALDAVICASRRACGVKLTGRAGPWFNGTMRIAPYNAWRPAAGREAEVACVPYDTVDREEARALADGKPWSFLRVVRAEIDCPTGTDSYAPAVYAQAAAQFTRMQEAGILRRDPVPAFYVYRQARGEHVQRGIVACCHVADYTGGVIRRHERTLEAKELDRTRLQEALRANAGPVFLTYRDEARVDALVAETERTPPLFTFAAEDGVVHAGWRLDSTDRLALAFERVAHAYVADGHHRAAAAVRMAREHKSDGTAPWAWFQAVLFPASQLKVMPYNRVVADLNGLTADAFLDAVRARFAVTQPAQGAPAGATRASLYVNGAWYGLSWEPDPAADPVARLDVSVLQDRLLGPVLGIRDPRRDTRIRFVGGIRGTAVLEAEADRTGGAAVSLRPVTVEQIMAVADAGRVMPPKSTWFEPKLRSGLFVHSFDG
jgi:uncharacterized protein (DUF1015 family)